MKIHEFRPEILCFNGKKAAETFLSTSVTYGLQKETINQTRLFVVPSTSQMAEKHWDEMWWFQLKEVSRK